MEFQERFASEEACREYLFACRWPDGFRCRRCGGGDVGVMHHARRVWQCKSCGAQTSGDRGHGDAQDADAAAAVVLAGDRRRAQPESRPFGGRPWLRRCRDRH
jgi:ribosomal protein L37AE/L43A